MNRFRFTHLVLKACGFRYHYFNVRSKKHNLLSYPFVIKNVSWAITQQEALLNLYHQFIK